MGLADFKGILSALTRGGEPTEEEKQQLFKEVALMTLARATSADTNIKHVEVETVQDVLKRITGEEVSLPDIRVAAKSEIFEDKPLDRYLAGVSSKLSTEARARIMGCLAEVIRADDRISHFETDYFDMVATALKATPSEIVGFIPAER